MSSLEKLINMSLLKNSSKYRLEQKIILNLVGTNSTLSRSFFKVILIKNDVNILKVLIWQNMNEAIDQKT